MSFFFKKTGQGTASLVAGKSACAPIAAKVACTSRFSFAQNLGHKCPFAGTVARYSFLLWLKDEFAFC